MRNNLFSRGTLSYSDFQVIYNSKPQQAFTAKQTWNFLIDLGLACALDDVKGESFMMLPCLISDKMEGNIEKNRQKMVKSPKSVSIQYIFDRTGSSVGMYYKLLQIFTRTFIWGEKGGQIKGAFSQKVEQRKLGMVGGVHGILKSQTKKGILKPQEFDFLLLEYEDTFAYQDLEEDASKPRHAVHRGIQIHLKPKKEDVIIKNLMEILKEADKVFSSTFDKKVHVQRCMLCHQCETDHMHGYFELNQDMSLKFPNQPCTQVLDGHELSESLIEAMKDSSESDPFKLQSLMKLDKSSLGLETFKTSQIMKDILTNSLPVGEQIWIYHDRETDRFNPVARTNPYAHCIVYVGSRLVEGMEVHEIVHVAKHSMRGCMKARIIKEDVMKAIQPHNQVFLGHKITSCQFSWNLRQKIAARALACAEQPRIVFNYNIR